MALRKIVFSENRDRYMKNRNGIVVGKDLTYNASAMIRYQRNITRLLRQMTDETKNKIKALFKKRAATSYFKEQNKVAAFDAAEIKFNIVTLAGKLLSDLQNKYDDLFNTESVSLSYEMFDDMLKISELNLKSSLKELSGGLLLDTTVIPKGLETVSKAIIKENVELIKTIPQQYFKQIQGSVMRSITTGNGLDQLIPEIDTYATRNLRHTRNMALDQTRKAYNNINKQRMLSLNIKKYRWQHNYGGQSPREDHIQMNGNVYSFSDPPVIDRRTGQRGIPGDAINCRCTMIPVWEFENE